MGTIVLIQPLAPANDVARSPALLALIDDLAKLAAALHVAGRLDPGQRTKTIATPSTNSDRFVVDESESVAFPRLPRL